jgi:HCOMODA/2-hydroxy-3-carboxy-muconic semialdehyde decarboxylase
MKSTRLEHDIFDRRHFLVGGSVLLAAALTGAARKTWSAQTLTADPGLIEDVVAANRILAALEIVDGYGHVSARHDKDPNRYLIARSVAPELVTTNDILELDLDSVPADGGKPKMYLERFIHGEIYKRRPDVRAIVHHHAASIIPFSVSNVALRPIYHMAAFIGQGVPVFDIREVAGDTDMLVRTPELGAALARTLADKPAALMRGHGAVVVGDSVGQAVGRSYYLQMDAKLQAQAAALGSEIRYLDKGEASKAEGFGGYERSWELWKRKALEK